MADNDFNPQHDDLYVPTFDEIQQKLNQQATALVNNGANYDEVVKRLQERTNALSQIWNAYGPSAFTPKSKQDEFGYPDRRRDFDVIENPTKAEKKDLDKTELPDSIKSDINGDIDIFSPSKAINRGLVRSMLRTEQGLAFVGQEFPEAERLSKEADTVGQERGTLNKVLDVAGGLPVAFATGGLAAAPNAAQEAIDRGQSLEQARQSTAITALGTEASLGVGALGRGLLSRGAAQLAAGPGVSELERRYQNEDLPADQQTQFDPTEFAVNSAVAAAGARAHAGSFRDILSQIKGDRESKAAIKDRLNDQANKFDEVKTGDPDIDTGIKAGKVDLYSGDINKTPPVEKQFAIPKVFDVSEKQDTQVNTEGLAKPPSESGPSMVAEETKAATQFPQGPEQVQVTEPGDLDGAGKRARTVLPESKNPAEFQYKKITQEQPELDFEGNKTLSANEPKTETDHTPKEREARRAALLDQIAKETGQPVPTPDNTPAPADGGNNYGIASLARSVWDAHDKGELTTQHVLDSIADNHDNLYDNNPEARNWTNVLRDLGNKLGGLDTKIEVIPSNPDVRTPEHNATVDRLNKYGAIPFDKAAGYYDPETNKIYIKGDHNLTPETLAHETTHAITHKAITLGMEGKLIGPQRQAFERLKTVFEQLKPSLEKNKDAYSQRLQDEKGLGPKTAEIEARKAQYGLTDLHEMMAEMFSNSKFRDYLKSVKLEGLQKQGVSMTVLGRVRNAYEAVVKNVRSMLGLSPKADHALDAMFSSSHEFFQSIDKPTAKEIAESNSHNTVLAKKDEEYKPPVTNPLSKWQRFKEQTGTTSRKLFTWSTTAPERAIRLAKETAAGESNFGRREAVETGKELNNAIKKEGADPAKVRDYMQGKDAKALDNAPETKRIVDEQFKKPSRKNALELATLIASNPNARKVDLDFAQELIENKDYTTRAYQNEAFSENLIKNAQAGDTAAKAVVDRAKEWIKSNLLPTPTLGNKTIAGLRTMAKALGINTPKELEGITNRSEKRAKLIELIKKSVPEYVNVDKAVERLLYEVAGITNKGNSPVAKYYRGVRLGDILTVRKDVPPELQALWGKIEDPASILIQTLVKQHNGIAQLKAQAAIRDAGLGKWLFDKKMEAPDGFTEKINGRKMGPLQDLITSPEIKQALNSQLELSTAGNSIIQALHSGNPDEAFKNYMGRAMINGWTKAVGLYKVKRLATDVGYYIMYAVGGPSIVMTHGIANPEYYGRGLIAHIGELSPAFLNALDKVAPSVAKQARADLEHIIKGGLNESSMAGELMQHQDALKLAEAVRAGAYGNFAQLAGKAIMAAKNKAVNGGITALSLTDGWAKRAALLHRMDVLDGLYSRQGEFHSPEEIRQEAADWIKDTTITNQRTPAAVRLMEKMGGSQGLIYGVETIRNVKNAVTHGAADIKRGYELGDKTLVLHGIKQLAGTGIAINYMGGIISALGGTILAASGMTSNKIDDTDKRQKFLQEKGSRFEGQRPEEITDPKNPDPTMGYLWAPGDRNDFFYQVSQPVHSLMDDYARWQAGEKIDPMEAGHRAFSAFTGTLFRNSFSQKFHDILTAQSPNWERDAPEMYANAERFYMDKLGLPKEWADRMISLEDAFRPEFVKHFDAAQEANASPAMKALMTAGVGVVPMPKDADLQNRTAGAINKKVSDIKARLGDTIKDPAEFSNDTIDSAYKRAFKDSYEVLKQAKNAVEYAQANGLKQHEVAKSMYIGKISEDVMDATLSGKMNPAELLYRDLSSKLEDEYNKAKTPEKQKELVRIYSARMKHLADLTRQYYQLTPDQIEAL